MDISFYALCHGLESADACMHKLRMAITRPELRIINFHFHQ